MNTITKQVRHIHETMKRKMDAVDYNALFIDLMTSCMIIPRNESALRQFILEDLLNNQEEI